MLYRFFILLLFLFYFQTEILSQPEKAKFEKDIVTEKYLVRLENNESDFFSGKINIYDLQNSYEVFKAENIFTNFNSDTLIDLDGDGRKELLLDLGTGATMYDFNMFLIFDFEKEIIVPAEVHNAGLITGQGQIPVIMSEVRLSPNYLSAGYSFTLKFENGKLIPCTESENSTFLKDIDISEKEIKELINDYIKETGECSDESQVQIYYEAYIMQKKINGQEKEGWKFFDKHYKCRDRKSVKLSLKKIIGENFRRIMDPGNYKFNPESKQ